MLITPPFLPLIPRAAHVQTNCPLASCTHDYITSDGGYIISISKKMVGNGMEVIHFQQDAFFFFWKPLTDTPSTPKVQKKICLFSLISEEFFFINLFYFGCAGSWGMQAFSSCHTWGLLSLWCMGLVAPRHVRSYFPSRGQTQVPYIGRWIHNHWTTREIPTFLKDSQSVLSAALAIHCPSCFCI